MSSTVREDGYGSARLISDRTGLVLQGTLQNLVESTCFLETFSRCLDLASEAIANTNLFIKRPKINKIHCLNTFWRSESSVWWSSWLSRASSSSSVLSSSKSFTIISTGGVNSTSSFSLIRFAGEKMEHCLRLFKLSWF